MTRFGDLDVLAALKRWADLGLHVVEVVLEPDLDELKKQSTVHGQSSSQATKTIERAHMNSDMKSRLDMVVMNMAVAFLLAREAKTSGGDLSVMHGAITAQLTEYFQKVAHTNPQFGQEAEAHIAESADSLWTLASAMHSKMEG